MKPDFISSSIRIRNANMLEVHELQIQPESERFYATWDLLGATLPGESIPQDVVPTR